MSQPIYQRYKETELQKRGIPLNTLITNDNYSQILLTKDSLRLIANLISEKTQKKLSTKNIESLVSFIEKLKPSKFYNLPLSEAHIKIALYYLERFKIQEALIKDDYANSIENITHLNEITDMPSISDYQQKEINQFTKNENQYKYAAFSDRRGNAVVDLERVNGIRSSPNNIESGKKISDDDVSKINYETLKMVKNFLDPAAIDSLLNRFSSTYTSFYSINLPHQVVPLDSRNRLLTNSNLTEYSWNIHTAGDPGHLGDIKIQDTLQQTIQMNIGSFWLPMYPVAGSYYNKIRMLIKEFTAQSNTVTEFLNSDQTQPTVYYYHFEFDITQTAGLKVLLTPVNNTFTFRKPFARIETLTISFRTPFNLMQFIPDRGVYNITFGNPTQFTITSNPAHLLNTGDLVYITNVDTINASINIAINTQIGWLITVTSATQFTIPFNSSILIGSNSGIDIYYGSQRIFFGLEFIN